MSLLPKRISARLRSDEELPPTEREVKVATRQRFGQELARAAWSIQGATVRTQPHTVDGPLGGQSERFTIEYQHEGHTVFLLVNVYASGIFADEGMEA